MHNNGKKGVYNYMQFCYSFNHEINEFCYFALFSETQSQVCAMCISLHVCVSLSLFVLCVLYCLTVCFRCDLFRFECMCVFFLHSLLLQLKIRCFCSVEWLIVWCALLPICYLFDKIDKSHRAQ